MRSPKKQLRRCSWHMLFRAQTKPMCRCGTVLLAFRRGDAPAPGQEDRRHETFPRAPATAFGGLGSCVVSAQELAGPPGLRALSCQERVALVVVIIQRFSEFTTGSFVVVSRACAFPFTRLSRWMSFVRFLPPPTQTRASLSFVVPAPYHGRTSCVRLFSDPLGTLRGVSGLCHVCLKSPHGSPRQPHRLYSQSPIVDVRWLLRFRLLRALSSEGQL